MTETGETEINSYEFFETVFTQPAEPPFTYRLSFNYDITIPFLTSFMQTAANTLFRKKIDELTEKEQETIRDYFKSIGYDYQIKKEAREKHVVDFNPRGERYLKPIKYFENLIEFKVAEFP